jgi:hypothetical protein
LVFNFPGGECVEAVRVGDEIEGGVALAGRVNRPQPKQRDSAKRTMGVGLTNPISVEKKI